MSYFKAILILLINFHTSSSLMGMDVYSNPYFEPKLQKTLTLIMLKNRQEEPFNQNPDVLKVIAQKNYEFYCDELLESEAKYQYPFKKLWELRFNPINNKQRINTYYGREIKINDFDFITMTNQGREVFLTALSVCERDHTYKYSSQHICEFNQAGINNHKTMIEKSFLFNHDEYKKILQLPLRLRSKLGNLSQMIIIGEEQFSCANAIFESGLAEGLINGGLIALPAMLMPTNASIVTTLFAGVCGGIGSYHIQRKHESFPTASTLLRQLFGGYTSKEVTERMPRQCTLIKQPLVPEKYAETLAFKKRTEQEFQRLKKNSIKHQHKTSHKLLTQE